MTTPKTTEQKVAALRQFISQALEEQPDGVARLVMAKDQAAALELPLTTVQIEGLIREQRWRLCGRFQCQPWGRNFTAKARPMLIVGLLPQGTTTLVIGAPKAGKTQLAIATVSALVHGTGTFVGAQVLTEAPPVLLVLVDQDRSDSLPYLSRAGLATNVGDEWTLHPKVVAAYGKGDLRLDSKGIETLSRHTRENPGLVVVADSLTKLMSGLGIKQNEESITDALLDLSEAVTRNGGTLLLVHHTTKGSWRANADPVEASRGSQDIAADASSIWYLTHLPKDKDKQQGLALEQDRLSNRRRLMVEGRGAPLDNIIEMDHNTCSAALICPYDAWQEQERLRQNGALTEGQAEAAQVLLEATAPLTCKEVAEQLGLDTEHKSNDMRKVRRDLCALVEKGKAVCHESGIRTWEAIRQPKSADTADTSGQGPVRSKPLALDARVTTLINAFAAAIP